MNTEIIRKEVEIPELERLMKGVTSFHRIQASPGMTQSARWCAGQLRKAGIQAELLSFPADDQTVFHTVNSFPEWDCRLAWLKLADGTVLADFSQEPLSVVQRSCACDYTEEPVELVLFEEGKEVRGKLVFGHLPVNELYRKAVLQGQAAGIVTDYMELDGQLRTEENMEEYLSYCSFWWNRGQKKTFGFVLSPGAGKKLHRDLIKAKEQGEHVFVNCLIDSEFRDGTLDGVSAFLPGKIEEEVLISAHLCHYCQGANDNASGVSAAMETVMLLNRLQNRGSIRLRRGIRLLLLPEMTGSIAWISRNSEAAKRCVAGINLDMVGGRQTDGYGPLTLLGLPKEAPDLAETAGSLLLDQLCQEVPLFMTDEKLPLIHWEKREFSPGSDNMIFSDPAVGIPCIMAGQWPDRYYHTSGDTLDRIDYAVMASAVSLSASYLLLLSAFCLEDLRLLLKSCLDDFILRLRSIGRDGITEEEYQRRLFRQREITCQRLRTGERYFSGTSEQEAVRLIDESTEEADRIFRFFTGLKERQRQKMPDPAGCVVPQRCFPTPNVYLLTARLVKNKEEDYRRMEVLSDRLTPLQKYELIYYVNGRRTLDQVIEAFETDCGAADRQVLYELFQVMERLLLIKYIQVKEC